MIAPVETTLWGWGMASRASSLVYRPRHPDEVGEAIRDARDRGLTIAARGAGLSYGDAALNSGGAVIDLSGLSRIVELDAGRGIVRAQAGVTIEALWSFALPSGWWPAVVPGSMKATLGGCVAMNVHGKNHFKAGALGRHVQSVTLFTGDAETRTPHRDAEGGLGLAQVVGAQGLTGTMVDVTLTLERVHSGFLEVEAEATPTLAATMEALSVGARDADHSVAWVDCMGRGAGRGVLHHAWHLGEGHPLAGKGLDLESQRLPERVLGGLPRGQVHRVLRPLVNRAGIRVLNAARYRAAAWRGRRYVQSHAAFHFLLDHVPHWKRAYGPAGLMQYQMFIPEASAPDAFAEALARQRALGVESFLGVMKRHAAEDLDASYSVDGFSLALDFPVPRRGGLAALGRLTEALDRIVEEHDGRIYAAKDAVGRGRLPRRRDPAFSSDLVRRWQERAPAPPHGDRGLR